VTSRQINQRRREVVPGEVAATPDSQIVAGVLTPQVVVDWEAKGGATRIDTTMHADEQIARVAGWLAVGGEVVQPLRLQRQRR
jgi:hypothetical protein